MGAGQSWLSVIQSPRLCGAEPFAYVSELLTKLAEYRNMPAERKTTAGDVFLQELLPAAWVRTIPEKRLALGR